MTHHVMCTRCEHIFAADAEPGRGVRCPACGFEGAPGGVMRVSGPPDTASFERTIAHTFEVKAARDATQDTVRDTARDTTRDTAEHTTEREP